MANVIIGKVRISKGTQFNQSYETAAWHKGFTTQENILVDVYGKYEEEEVAYLGKVGDNTVHYTVEGICDSSDFTSHWMGSPIGKGKVNEHVGEKMRVTRSPYAHSVANDLVNEPYKTRHILNDDFRARKQYYIWQGEIKSTCGIYYKGLDLCGDLMERPELSEYIFNRAKTINGKEYAVIFFEQEEEYHLVEVKGGTVISIMARSYSDDATEWDNWVEIREAFEKIGK